MTANLLVPAGEGLSSKPQIDPSMTVAWIGQEVAPHSLD